MEYTLCLSLHALESRGLHKDWGINNLFAGTSPEVARVREIGSGGKGQSLFQEMLWVTKLAAAEEGARKRPGGPLSSWFT